MTQTKKPFRSGFVTIVGRPNVGKSTLMNALIGEKIAIVSSRPQTTRSRIMGVLTDPDWQMVFLDTPGIHQPRNELGEYMMKAVRDAMDGMDVLLAMVDVTSLSSRDEEILREMAGKKCPRVLVLNKIDLTTREALLGLMARFGEQGWETIVPVSAKTGYGLPELKQAIAALLPEGPHYFPDDMVTDQPERLICAELIREKALRNLRDEVPHGIGVEMMLIRPVSDTLTEIHATIYCERESHKGIIIGKQGSMLQRIGSEARADIERLMDTHVNLQLRVKVRPDWRDRKSDLRDMGYDS